MVSSFVVFIAIMHVEREKVYVHRRVSKRKLHDVSEQKKTNEDDDVSEMRFLV